nr:hypothetical protein [Tanacetum cinerariifolium]
RRAGHRQLPARRAGQAARRALLLLESDGIFGWYGRAHHGVGGRIRLNAKL